MPDAPFPEEHYNLASRPSRPSSTLDGLRRAAPCLRDIFFQGNDKNGLEELQLTLKSLAVAPSPSSHAPSHHQHQNQQHNQQQQQQKDRPFPSPPREDFNPRARKRRRADSGASSNDSIAAADHQELAELSVYAGSAHHAGNGLPYNTAVGAVSLHPLNTSSNEAPASRYEPVEDHHHGHQHHQGHHHHSQQPHGLGIENIYTLGNDQKMMPGVGRPMSSGKFQSSGEYGPYHAQYWSLVEDNLDAGTPLASNGGYQSPYGSLAPEVYFSAVADHSPHPAYPGTQPHQPNGYDHPDGSAYNLVRGSQYMPSDAANVYPSPVEAFGWNYSGLDSSMMQALPMLENLSTQILTMLLSCASIEETMAVASRSDAANGQAYANLESMFESASRPFTRDHSNLFIDWNLVHLNSSSALATIRKANLTIFAASIFRGRDVPFIELNNAFLEIFMPAGTRLLKNEGALFLELKTQAYMAIMMNSDLPREDVLDQLFPRDLQLTILRRRSEPAHLAPSEQDFISRVNTRRQYLLAGSDDVEGLSQLPRKYLWKEFLEELKICAKKSLESLGGMTDSKPSQAPEDPITKAALAAHAAIAGQNGTLNQGHGHHHQYASPSLLQSPFSHKRTRSSPISDMSSSPDGSSAPHHMKYQQVRPLNGIKPHTPFTTTPRRLPGTPSTRRPWTPEEEKALTDGLERVKGPHWSQILALYGAGGSLGEVLKDRNQVQLKDKARNLKLFFLKSGLEVPCYLAKVTGELKTRAPAQAAKLEAKERLKAIEGRK